MTLAASDVPALAAGPFTRLPPGRRHVLVPTSSRRSALAGLTLVSGSRRSTVLVQALCFAAVWSLSPAVLPGPRESWVPPLGPAHWAQLLDELVAVVGPVDGVAVYEQPQPVREGLALLLLRSGRSVGFVKLRRSPAPVALEADALRVAEAANPDGRPFRALTPYASGSTGDWSWLVMEPLPTRPHRPSRLADVAGLGPWVRAVVEAVVPRPPDVPAHWVGVHGDLVPWNLRTSGSALYLLDWEQAAWAPPGTDEVYYRAASSAVHRVPPPREPEEQREAAERLADAVRARRSSADDVVLSLALESALDAMLGRR